MLGWKLPSRKFSQVEAASKSCQPHPDRTVGESGFPWDSGNLLWIQRKSLRKSRLTIKAVGPTWIYHRRGKTLSPPWWIRGLFPHHSVSEVPPRAIPWWWNDPLSVGLQTSQKTLPRLSQNTQATRSSFSGSLTEVTPVSSCNMKEWKPLWWVWHDTNSAALLSLPTFALCQPEALPHSKALLI